ncbi:hypothetical protein RB298_04770 [Priestia sp. BR_2]
MSDKEFWQLAEFANEIDMHYTTTNDWFKTLESKGIHYVARAADGKRVYDALDLKVGKFIKSMREDGWNKEGIFNLLADKPPFELRPLPDNMQATSTDLEPTDQMRRFLQSSEFTHLLEEQIGATIIKIMEEQRVLSTEDQTKLLSNAFEEQATTITDKITELQQLNEAARLEQRQQRITERITDHRINSELELEALNKWAEMPASERMKKVSLFRKEEDDLKRQLFVKQYIRDHYESRLRSEMEEQGKNPEGETS